MELRCSATHLGSVGTMKGADMDYKAEILELVQLIENEKLLRFIYYMIDDSLKRYDSGMKGLNE